MFDTILRTLILMAHWKVKFMAYLKVNLVAHWKENAVFVGHFFNAVAFVV